MTALPEPKIVFVGPPGAGKTTAIAAISDVAPVCTDVRNTDPALAKAQTTVGLDYGEVHLGEGERVRLFGTPGQDRFDFMWRILAQQALGLVVLIDNSRPDPVGDLRRYLDAFAPTLDGGTACVIGVGRLESHAQPGLADFNEALAEQGRVLPLLAVDVRQREDVLMLLDVVLAQVEARQFTPEP